VLGVISCEELYKMSENILRNLDKQMWLGFKEIIESRDNARKKSNPMYQGAGDIEDKSNKFGPNFNQSYKKLPSSYPFFRNSTWDKIARENINVKYVSCPLGADKNTAKKPYDEGVVKKIFLKNTFEEMLFHIEDERFELDVNIAKFRMVIKWLEMLSDPSISEEREDFLFDKILKFDVLQKIYTSKTEEYFTAVKEHKDIVLPKV
jgi:histone deacetylase complex regulatory component SIN3